VSLFKTHKPGQARLSRMITLLSGLFLIAWGCRSLLRTLSSPTFFDGKLGLPINVAYMGAPEKDGWRADWIVVNENLSIAFLIGVALLLVLGGWWWRFVNKERWAELLIEMETELRKVSWPSPSDAWQSTLVVTGFTFTVVGTILVYDLVIKGFIELFVRT
jgi:preprotein translocase SecE subunit